MQLIDLVGIEYGPIVVTATDLGEGLQIRCPHCNTSSSFQDDWLGQEIACPNKDCGKPLKVNPFVVERRR